MLLDISEQGWNICGVVAEGHSLALADDISYMQIQDYLCDFQGPDEVRMSFCLSKLRYGMDVQQVIPFNPIKAS